MTCSVQHNERAIFKPTLSRQLVHLINAIRRNQEYFNLTMVAFIDCRGRPDSAPEEMHDNPPYAGYMRQNICISPSFQTL